MSFLRKIFSSDKLNGSTEESVRAMACLAAIEQLDSKDSFISKREYAHLKADYSDVTELFNSLKKSKMFGHYCQSNNLDRAKLEDFLVKIDSLDVLFKVHNDRFVKQHLEADRKYLDGILKDVDPSISLDEEQRTVVLSDQDYTLVIAGAGAGKTTTLAAKVKYLVEKKGVAPEDILVISFTNKAVGELREKINRSLGIPCPVTTFHSTGYAILKVHDAAKKRIVEGGFLYDTINKYLQERILKNPELVDKLILFFGSYFDSPYEGDDLNAFFNYIAKADFTTLKSDLGEYTAELIDSRNGQRRSIKHEKLRSAQEVQIANFLYLNSIEYEYEKVYPYHILKAGKPYTPDFTITQGDRIVYLEHFGITEDGRNNRYTQAQIERYKHEVNEKIMFHRKHKSELIYTFSQYNDGRYFLDHLADSLTRAGIELKPRPTKEVYEKLISTEENRYIQRLVKLIMVFISNFKVDGFENKDFDRLERINDNVRTRLFLEICQECYLDYTRRLKQYGAIDFQDMINDSAKILDDLADRGEKLNYKYIIVDEYQDISHQRFDLTRSLARVSDAKIIAVGDDWQAIYAYAGADISLFTQFSQIFGYADQLQITHTYRNAQEVIDIAGGFIQKNSSQIKKSLISPKTIQHPVIINTYDETAKLDKEGKGGKFAFLGETVFNIITEIRTNWRGKGSPSILVIGRYGFDVRSICMNGRFTYDEKSGRIRCADYPRAKIEYLTAHRSKGLGYDEVIIINARDEIYGFPSQIDDDPVLKLVTKSDHSIDYAEERRLFYVAMTRTKNHVYMAVPQQRPSVFVRELLADYSNIELIGTIDDDLKQTGNRRTCPVCGYPLQHRFRKNYGLNLWVCTNEPEICDFMTNAPSGGELSILKCDCCKDGFLIVKKGPSSYFLGCTNYKHDGSGCNRVVTLEEYRKLNKQ